MLALSTNSDFVVQLAWWAGKAAAIGAVLLLICVFLLHVRQRSVDRHRKNVIVKWRPILTETILRSWDETIRLPRLHSDDMEAFLHEWNVFHDSITGEGSIHLNKLARKLKIDRAARRMLRDKRVYTKLLAVATLGHLKDQTCWELLEPELDADNLPLSLVAARALVQIDATRAVPLIIPRILERDDWPPGRLGSLLQEAGPGAVVDSLRSAISSGTPEGIGKLVIFLDAMPGPEADEIISQLLRDSDDGRVIASCLNMVKNPADLPLLRQLTCHHFWHIRMLSAKALGRIGKKEDTDQLIRLLTDSQWWVRYRAAQALARLPWISQQILERIQSEQTDGFAADILEQVMAEGEYA